MGIKQSRTYAASFRIDGPTQDRLAWLTSAIDYIMPGTRVSNSTLMRRAVACYVNHIEHVIGTGSNSYTKPRLIQAEGFELQHFRQEHKTLWDKLPQEALYDADGKFVLYSKLIKSATKALPSAIDRLVQEFPPEVFRRRAD